MKKLIVKKKSIGPIDPYAQNVSLLLHMNGANGSTTFTDSSLNNFTVTRYGDAQISTAQKKYGDGSAYFDGNGDYLQTTISDWSMGVGGEPYTIEFWVYVVGSGIQVLLAKHGGVDAWNGTNGLNFNFYITSSNIYYNFYNSGEVVISNPAIPTNQWVHLAAVYDGTVTKVFVDGIQQPSTSSVSYQPVPSANTLEVGSQVNGNFPFNGYIDDLRITKGIARYTSNFTPPQQQLPDPSDPYIDNVSLLLHMDQNQFADASYNNFTITPFGNARSSTQVVKYGDTAAYFDGNGDYLTAPDSTILNFNTTDNFTIEGWIRFNSLEDGVALVSKGSNSTFSGWTLYYYQGLLYFGVPYVSNDINGTFTPSLNTWYHLACIRNSGTIKLFVDGSEIASSSNSINYTTTEVLRVGYSHSNNFLNGYIDDLRITKGIARYTSNFTPPSAQLSPLNDPYFNDVSLLLQTNRPFTDSSTNNFQLTAFGDAQINTVTKKFGSGAGYFDGNGDYLQTPNLLNFASQDWTIEFWLYANTQTDKHIIANVGPGQDGINIYLDGSNNITYNNGNTVTTVGTSYTSYWNQWTHIALVRSGSTISMYVNGTLAGTPTNQTPGSNQFLYIGKSDYTGYDFTGYIDELRITKGIARYTSAFSPPIAPFSNPGPSLISSNNKLQIKKSISRDSFFNDVSLLLHMNGANGSSNFVDSSNNNFSISRFGDTVISNAQSKFGGTSAYFDGNGDYLVLEDNEALSFNTGFNNSPNIPFTIEAWIYPTVVDSTVRAIIAKDTYGSNFSWCLAFNNTFIACYTHNINSDWQFEASASVQTNTWQHIAVTSDGTTQRLFLNGQLLGSKNAVITNASSKITIGCFSWSNPGNFFNGYIDDLRITKGINRYTNNFTPPNQQFPDTFGLELSNKKLQIKKSSPIIFPPDYLAFWKLNNLLDSSINGNNLTNNGGVQFVAGKIGNCAQFNGSNTLQINSLSTTIAANADRTFSIWCYRNSVSSNDCLFGSAISATGYFNIWFNGTTLKVDNGQAADFSISNIDTYVPAETWCHIVMLMESDIIKIYVNNVLRGSAGRTVSYSALSQLGVGNFESSIYFNGKLDAAGVWNRPLTTQEIAALYNNGNGLEP